MFHAKMSEGVLTQRRKGAEEEMMMLVFNGFMACSRTFAPLRLCVTFGLLISIGLIVAPRVAAQPHRPANRLAEETSPYLLQHAHNPVDWYPWGQEALA